MEKVNAKPKDITSYGEIWDEDGEWTFEDNLINLFKYLNRNGHVENKNRKYIFYVSKIYGTFGNPYRGVKERTATIRKLLKCWRGTFGEPFSPESLKRVGTKNKFDINLWEVQARKEHAWGSYSAHVRRENERKEYEDANKLPDGEKQKEVHRLKNRANLLVIG